PSGSEARNAAISSGVKVFIWPAGGVCDVVVDVVLCCCAAAAATAAAARTAGRRCDMPKTMSIPRHDEDAPAAGGSAGASVLTVSASERRERLEREAYGQLYAARVARRGHLSERRVGLLAGRVERRRRVHAR